MQCYVRISITISRRVRSCKESNDASLPLSTDLVAIANIVVRGNRANSNIALNAVSSNGKAEQKGRRSAGLLRGSCGCVSQVRSSLGLSAVGSFFPLAISELLHQNALDQVDFPSRERCSNWVSLVCFAHLPRIVANTSRDRCSLANPRCNSGNKLILWRQLCVRHSQLLGQISKFMLHCHAAQLPFDVGTSFRTFG